LPKNFRNQIYELIETDWPMHTTEIANKLGFEINDENKKRVLGRIKYHLDIMAANEKILTKKIGGARVVWPHEIERIRFVHEMLR
jgi:predicted transcriptional regulator